MNANNWYSFIYVNVIMMSDVCNVYVNVLFNIIKCLLMVSNTREYLIIAGYSIVT